MISHIWTYLQWMTSLWTSTWENNTQALTQSVSGCVQGRYESSDHIPVYHENYVADQPKEMDPVLTTWTEWREIPAWCKRQEGNGKKKKNKRMPNKKVIMLPKNCTIWWEMTAGNCLTTMNMASLWHQHFIDYIYDTKLKQSLRLVKI